MVVVISTQNTQQAKYYHCNEVLKDRDPSSCKHWYRVRLQRKQPSMTCQQYLGKRHEYKVQKYVQYEVLIF